MAGEREKLVERLGRLKELSGLSQRALARATGLSNSSLSRYLTGQLVPPWDALVALCKAVGRDPRPLRPLWTEAMKAEAMPAPRRNDLPADLADFTGRSLELAMVKKTLATGSSVSIDGMGGVGKTSLAVHAAHSVAGDYPDGGLYLDLRGFTPGQEPLDAFVALERLLGALDVARIPGDMEERAGLWRSELSRRRVLVVLDNAVDAAHVASLLPGAGKSAALITSRNRLVGLHGVPPVSLEPLSRADSADLFTRAAGIASDADVAQVLEQCGGLPLALRMAGARLLHRPGWTVAVLAERLRDSAGRFDAVFEMSARQLDSQQRRVFRLLGVLPGSDFDAAVVAALAELRPGQVAAVLEELVDAHLVQEPAPGRYRLHDLIRDYAADLATAEEPRAAEAVHRVLRHYLDLAVTHDKVIPFLHRRETLPGDRAAALAWFDREYANLIACFDTAVTVGADEIAMVLPKAMRAWFFRRAGTGEKVRLFEAAVQAAERLGDRPSRSALLLDLGFAHAAAGNPTKALAAYDGVHTDDLDAEDRAGLALRRGYTLLDLGELDAAGASFTLAHQLMEHIGYRAGLSQALAFEAWVALHLGRPDQAAELARAAVDHADGVPQITGLVTLGVALAYSDPAASLATLGDALRQSEQDDHRHNQAWCLNYLGVALRIMGSPEEGLEQHRAAFSILEELGEAQWELDFLHTYAETFEAAGRPGEALALHERTIELARELGRDHDEKRALEAIAALGEPVVLPADRQVNDARLRILRPAHVLLCGPARSWREPACAR
ncbi:ATP-binding protein [Actinorhabdospora filicis]|uniref:ATP-binding protein n=1 Tax=Actinorhabdospora filicis TaxID=1785913 RepID=UPI0025523323|nr:tetratricopeptide repeat protein [Actinorhabdospora filicis]